LWLWSCVPDHMYTYHIYIYYIVNIPMAYTFFGLSMWICFADINTQ
jgi:hypothetical protein